MSAENSDACGAKQDLRGSGEHPLHLPSLHNQETPKLLILSLYLTRARCPRSWGHATALILPLFAQSRLPRLGSPRIDEIFPPAQCRKLPRGIRRTVLWLRPRRRSRVWAGSPKDNESIRRDRGDAQQLPSYPGLHTERRTAAQPASVDGWNGDPSCLPELNMQEPTGVKD